LKKQLAIWAGLCLLGLGATGTAGAQTIYAGPGYASPGYASPGLPDPALPPYEIMSIVRSTGLAPVTRPVRRGPYYVLVAVDRVGREMRVVIDAQLGDIVNLRPALAAGSYGPELGRPNGPPGFAAAPPDTTGARASYGARPGSDPRQTDPRPSGDLYGAHPSAENAPPPTPPRPIPSARASAPPPNVVSPPPTRLAVAEPALPPPPPLPRPRPKLALNEPSAAAPTVTTAAPPAPKPATPAASPLAAPNAADEAAKSIE
jgi:hypothetical protein